MAKGFGAKPSKQLGYVLSMMPGCNAYAGKFSLDFRGEEGPFIGIVGQLEDAQVWKSLKQAKQAIKDHYMEFILEQVERESETAVTIRKLERLGDGKLKTENVEVIRFGG